MLNSYICSQRTINWGYHQNMIFWGLFLSNKITRNLELHRLAQFYRRLDKYAAVVVYFSTREFKFEEGNADRLWNSLDSTDQEMFPFNMAAMDWNMYLRSYVLGCRQFLLKEEHNTIVASRRRIKMWVGWQKIQSLQSVVWLFLFESAPNWSTK